MAFNSPSRDHDRDYTPQNGRSSSNRNHSRSSTSSSASSRTANNNGNSSYFTFPVTYSVNGLLRRLSGDSGDPAKSHTPPRSQPKGSSSLSSSLHSSSLSNSAYAPAPVVRRESPFQPPPLTPLTLEGWKYGTQEGGKLLSRALAEEIRLLVPARLQLCESWHLVFGLEQDGVSLATLYQKCDEYRGKRGGFVLVVKDGGGGIFGAFLTDAPHPAPHFYGTGECFLWRASILPAIPSLANLPPPPSEDTTHATRMTQLSSAGDGTSTPDRIRFKAFPYSGINDYMIFCETGYLSVGGGDGHYGLWLDDNLEEGISEKCPTFGNEPLSDEGRKFDVLGVELWYMGS